MQKLTFIHFFLAKEIKEVAPDICIQFLLTAGQCPSKKCSYHHYHHLPYCWQYKISGSSGGDSWKNFKKKDCENIEKYFCDVNLPAAELNISTKIMADVSRYYILMFFSQQY